MENHQIAAIVVFPLAFLGVCANWTVAILITNLKSMKNAFGRLTGSQSIGDAMHSSLFAFYFVPMCFFDNQWLKNNSKHCGHILLIAYDISTYSHLLISLNRFSSIMFPMSYEKIFSMKNTNNYIAISWTLAILPSFYLYVYNDCKFFYIDDFWVFTFSTTPVCQTITWYADFIKYNSIVILIVIIDIITVIKVRLFNKKLENTSTCRKRSNEINFLKQACLQALVFVFELITYFIITPKVGAEYRWGRFFLSTVAWVCVHMLDGIITIIFNGEFSKLIFNKMNIKRYSISTHVSTTNH
ncbi:unnamed protein product [Caenorhabditis angaria]|uniref:G-protein coupled receptors family 1 profile domain-containing protein n=1 Tax=Caenorhabditis angaria TaxID=860376 RepID=A0A9P1INZ6_9PELO|nr:unnamed protein product [Caenorhabditis angaria]